MNAAEQVHSVAFAHALASSVTLVRQHFPAASVSLNPWRDDVETRKWCEKETVDFAFYFPGWSPRLQCRSLLVQLRLSEAQSEPDPYLMGILMRGMTYEGERWRLATVGNWELKGSFLPHPDQRAQLQEICRGLFTLFPKGAY